MPTRPSISIACCRASCLADVLVQRDRLDDLVADGVDRAERGHRLLEDHGDLVAADARGSRCRVARAWPGRSISVWLAVCRSAVKEDLARRRSVPGVLDELQDREGGDALAAAALAHHAQRPAALDRQIDAVDGLDDAFVQEEVASSGPLTSSRVSSIRHHVLVIALRGVRIGGVAQAVAQEVERQHRDDHGNGRASAARAPWPRRGCSARPAAARPS